MNKFLLLKARTRPLLDRARQRLSEQGVGLLPYHPSRIVVHEFPESLVLLVCFEIAQSGGFDKRYSCRSDAGVLAFDGLPYWPGQVVSGDWAAQLQQRWTGDEALIASTFGTWSVARFSPQAGGRAVGDFTGMTPLFYWSDDDYLAVSPRQLLLSGVLGDGALDAPTLAWLSGQSNLIGEDSAWRGVKHLPPQWTLAFSGVPGDLALTLTPREIWSRDIDPAPDRRMLARATDSMLDQCEALSHLPLPPLRLDITGGLDSRLVLALALASPLRDRIEHLQTSGTENSEEIQVGRMLAAQVGLRHVERTPGAASVTPEKVLNSIRESVFRYEASICPTDGVVGVAANSRVILTGSAGEIYRRHCKPHMKVAFSTEQELVEQFGDYHQPTDPLGVQAAWVRDSQRSIMRALALGYRRSGAALDDITDIFFMRYRLPLWNGVMMNNIQHAVRIYPLVNYETARYAFSRGASARVTDRIHFEVMLQVSPDLCSLPFLRFVWPQAYREYALSRGTTMAAHQFDTVLPPPHAQQTSRQAVLLGEGWDMAMSYLLDAPANCDLWEIIDRRELERVAREGSSGFRGVVPGKEVFSLLAMRAALTGDWLPARDGRAVPPTLEGPLAQAMFGPR